MWRGSDDVTNWRYCVYLHDEPSNLLLVVRSWKSSFVRSQVGQSFVPFYSPAAVGSHSFTPSFTTFTLFPTHNNHHHHDSTPSGRPRPPRALLRGQVPHHPRRPHPAELHPRRLRHQREPLQPGLHQGPGPVVQDPPLPARRPNLALRRRRPVAGQHQAARGHHQRRLNLQPAARQEPAARLPPRRPAARQRLRRGQRGRRDDPLELAPGPGAQAEPHARVRHGLPRDQRLGRRPVHAAARPAPRPEQDGAAGGQLEDAQPQQQPRLHHAAPVRQVAELCRDARRAQEHHAGLLLRGQRAALGRHRRPPQQQRRRRRPADWHTQEAHRDQDCGV